MSIELSQLIWKNYEKKDKDDIWPKKNIGAALVYLDDENKYFLLGGNHDAYENELTNYALNKEIIKTVDTNPSQFAKAEQTKLNYIKQNVTNKYYSMNNLDLYIYELDPEPHWYKTTTTGPTIKPRSFHKCIYITPYIFLYGGVELGPKSENLSNEDMYVLNTKTFQWKRVTSNVTPFNRTDFQWVKIESRAFLYGGASSPSNKLYDDMWVFKHNSNKHDLFVDDKNEVMVENIWKQLEQNGTGPGKIKAYAMEYYRSALYLFGGVNSAGENSNTMYKFDLKNNKWSILETSCIPPKERCYHGMSLINQDTLMVFGGINGTMNNIKETFNDIYLLNLNELKWVKPEIGGIPPAPRIGFSYCCNYLYGKMEIMILGGNSMEDNTNLYTIDKNKNYVKIYVLCENDKTSNFYWTIRDVNYKAEQNDDNFLYQAEKSIYEFKEKISALEMDTCAKEKANEEMKKKINDYKKQFYQKHGFIDDQSQSLEDQINEQENQKNKMKENYEIDQEITNLKMKLRYIIEKKTDKTMDFFNETLSIFMNYYDAMCKIINVDQSGELADIFNENNLEEMKERYQDKLLDVKAKMEKFQNMEDNITTELHRYKENEKSCEETFKSEIENCNLNKNP